MLKKTCESTMLKLPMTIASIHKNVVAFLKKNGDLTLSQIIDASSFEISKALKYKASHKVGLIICCRCPQRHLSVFSDVSPFGDYLHSTSHFHLQSAIEAVLPAGYDVHELVVRTQLVEQVADSHDEMPVFNMIPEATRRHIFDFFLIEKISWSGRLNESDFLARLYDLQQMPSNDGRFSDASGDIWQHRVNNPFDWDDDWIIYDKRFNLLHCADEILLKFLCEAVHPAVRQNGEECLRIVNAFNDALIHDGYKITTYKQISGKNFYEANRILDNDFLPIFAKELYIEMNSNYILSQIERMESSIETDPENAIGASKEFIETICKTILVENNVENTEKLDFNMLTKEARKILNILPGDVDNQKKGLESIRKVLQSASTMVDGLGEIRNLYGTGHGKVASAKGLEPRHARLAVGIASTLGRFFYDCHERQKKSMEATR